MKISGLEIDQDLVDDLEFLTKNPDEIYDNWNDWSPLFARCTNNKDYIHCGCLTQVKNGLKIAQTEELTQLIRKDELIPGDENNIGLKHLPIFAWWQQRMRNYFKNFKSADQKTEVNYEV